MENGSKCDKCGIVLDKLTGAWVQDGVLWCPKCQSNHITKLFSTPFLNTREFQGDFVPIPLR